MKVEFQNVDEILRRWWMHSERVRLCDFDGCEGIEYGTDQVTGLRGIGSQLWPKAVNRWLEFAGYKAKVTKKLLKEICAVRDREGAGAWPHSAALMCEIASQLPDGFDRPEQLETDVLLRFISEQAEEIIRADQDSWKMTPGMREFHALLKDRRVKAAICTSACRLGYVETLVGIFQLSEHFQFTMGAEDVIRLGLGFKPNVDPWLHCLEKLEASHDASILITEDNPRNLAAAVHGLLISGFSHVHGLFIGRPGRDEQANREFFQTALIEQELQSIAEQVVRRVALVNYDDLDTLPSAMAEVLNLRS